MGMRVSPGFTQRVSVAAPQRGYSSGVPSDLGSEVLFVVLFLAGLVGLLCLPGWSHRMIQHPVRGPVLPPCVAGPPWVGAIGLADL